MIYKILENENGFKILTRTNEDGSISYIPTDPSNSDYQAYLKSLEENN